MRRRRLLPAFVALAAPGFVACWVLAFPPPRPATTRPPGAATPPGVTEESYARIRPGLTEQEVAAVFGEPGSEWGLSNPAAGVAHLKCWHGNRVDFFVAFDEAWRVVWAHRARRLC